MLLPERHVGSKFRKQGVQAQAGVMEVATNHLDKDAEQKVAWGGSEQRP